MKQTREISDDLPLLIQSHLQKNPDLTISDLIQEALAPKLGSEPLEKDSVVSEVAAPQSNQVEKFMALSGIVKQALRHSDERAEDYD